VWKRHAAFAEPAQVGVQILDLEVGQGDVALVQVVLRGEARAQPVPFAMGRVARLARVFAISRQSSFTRGIVSFVSL